MTEQDKAHELKFWEGFIKTERFLKGWCSNEKTPELRQEVYDFIKSKDNPTVLDVGSGVVSILHGTVSEEKLSSCDPLASDYKDIFDYKAHGIKAPIWYKAEDITIENTFDIVHCSNAIDHTQDIQAAFLSMFRAVKPGGSLIIQCFENEGSHENWQGFHQHNVRLQGDELISLQKDGSAIKVTPNVGYQIVSTQRIPVGNKTWVIWICRKMI